VSKNQLFDEGLERPRMLEEPRRKKAAKKKRGSGLAIIGGLFAGGAGLVLVWTLLLVLNPKSPLNPFLAFGAQPTPTLFVPPTFPPTAAVLPPTWTPSPIPTSSPITPTGIVRITATPTVQSTLGLMLDTPAATATISVFPFTLKDEIDYAKNTTSDGCAWMSIAGAVFDIDGNPLTNVIIVVSGESFEQAEWAGSATRFGPSGYEVFLNTSPYVANWTIQLLNYNVMPLSDRITVKSSSDCNRNVVMVNFQQNHDFSR
jgi:hypothetical protein